MYFPLTSEGKFSTQLRCYSTKKNLISKLIVDEANLSLIEDLVNKENKTNCVTIETTILK